MSGAPVNDIIKLATALAGSALMGQGRRVAVRTATNAALTIAAMLCVMAAIVSALAATWFYLAPLVGAPAAALIVAGIFLALGLALLGFMRFGRRRAPVKPQVDDATTQLLRDITELFKEHKGSALVAALVAGLLAGRTAR